MKLKVFFWLMQRAGFLLLFSILISQPSTVFGQGTAFTYQGRLGQNGSPYDGPAEMQFTLFNVPSGGTAIAANTPATASVDVNNGLFTIALDFGIGAFNGDARWLEIAVRTNGAGAFTTLAPRQQISAAPYAITAREVTGSVPTERLIGTIQVANIGAGTIHSNHLAAGSIHSNLLALGSIHSNHLVLGSIHSNHLALGSIHSNHLALGSIHSNHLAVGSVHSNALAVGSIHSNHLSAGSIHSNALALGSVTATALAAGSIHSNHLAAGSIHSNALALGSVTATALGDGVIHSNHLAVGSVHSNALVLGSIHSNHLAVGSVHSNALAVGSIHSNHLSAGSIHSNALALGSVTATALAAGSIHSNHLAEGSVHSNALVIGSIHSNHLAAGSIHSNALALGSVTATALAAGSIHSNHLAVGSVHSNALAVGSIHSNHLSAGSIHSNALALGSVTATALAVGSIHSNHLAAGSVDSSALVLGSIHSNHLAAGSVSLDVLNTAVGGAFSTTFNHPNPEFDYFGQAVAALGSDKVLVGAYDTSIGADNAGSAYLLSTSGALLKTFLKPVPANQDRFGISIAAVGPDKVLVGADGDDAGALDAGAAYLFDANGTLITTFTNPTPATADFFGYSVAAVGNDKVLIGAYADHFGANVGGAAYLFTTNRILLMTFNNPTPASGDRFGIAVAAVGADKVLIGADRDDAGVTDSGVAYLFHINGTLLATFNNPTPELNDAFGCAVTGVGPNAVLIGAHGDHWSGNAGGAAYLFNTSGALLNTFTNPTPETGDQFGIAVATVGEDKVVIGAASDNSGVTDAGAAYLFGITGNLLWTFNNPAPSAGELFGIAVTAVGTDKVLVGAPQDAGAVGAVHLWTLSSYVPGLALDPSIGVLQKSGANISYTSGNVGIGTSNPEYKLDVAGAVRISNFGHGAEVLNLSTERSWAFRQLGTGAATALELASIGGGGNKNFVINTTGLVGIGTTSPQATLQVSGNNSHLRLHDTGRGNYWNIYTENHPNQASSGNLLFVPGPGGAYSYIRKSDGNYFASSDARLKEGIENLDGVLDRLLQLRPVSYRFKAAPEGPRTFGLIAQEVEPLFPEVVAEREGIKSLAYSALVPVTVGAIQELNQKLTDELKQKTTEIAELRQSVDELKTLVNALIRKSNGGVK
jgi:hypothetical protein